MGTSFGGVLVTFLYVLMPNNNPFLKPEHWYDCMLLCVIGSAGRQAAWLVSRQAGRQAYGQAGRQEGKQRGREEGKQAGRGEGMQAALI